MTAEELQQDLQVRREQAQQAIARVWELDLADRPLRQIEALLGPKPALGQVASYQPKGRPGTVAGLAASFRSGELSPVEALRETLARAESEKARLNAFIELLPERAMGAARASEERHRRKASRGPMDGVPIAIKDLVDVAGVRTTAASRVLLDNVAIADAPVVQALDAAGAVIFGKTNLHEFAYGGTGDMSHFGPVHNPRQPDHMAGGSSSGSAAAVGGAICPAALGTDTGGSIRIPAAACGVVGLKPTYGRVPTAGVIPLSWSLDHAGPLAGTVEDAGLALSAMCDFVPPDLGGGPEQATVGVCRAHFFDRLDAEVRTVVERALNMLGEVTDVAIPHINAAAPAQAVITGAEGAAYHHHWLLGRSGEYQPLILNRLSAAREFGGLDYVQAQRIRGLVIEEMMAALQTVDVLASPTLPIPAPKLFTSEVQLEDGPLNVIAAMIRNTGPMNLTGFPAISIPCGVTKDGMPVGLQLTALPWQEDKLLRVARRFEVALGQS
ncbi:MAG: amidase [Chloroflexi bacterium]|nr:amidase [Chloroflexota bacterium]